MKRFWTFNSFLLLFAFLVSAITGGCMFLFPAARDLFFRIHVTMAPLTFITGILHVIQHYPILRVLFGNQGGEGLRMEAILALTIVVVLATLAAFHIISPPGPPIAPPDALISTPPVSPPGTPQVLLPPASSVTPATL